MIVTFCPATDGSGLEAIVIEMSGQDAGWAPPQQLLGLQQVVWQQLVWQQFVWQHPGTTSTAAVGGPQQGVLPPEGTGQMNAPAEGVQAPSARTVRTKTNGTSRRRITTSRAGR